ncbi:MAG: polysaccharide biosynthesis tyrosine autokinase, partial [Pseudomonadota bacterium]
RLVQYAKDEGILDLSSAGGSEIGSSLDASALSALNESLADAQSERILARLKLDEMQDAKRRGALNSPLIEDLSRRRSLIASTYAEKLNTLKPDFPEMIDLQARIKAIDTEVEVERDRLILGVETEYRTALGTEETLEERITDLKRSLQNLRNRSIDYNILSRDVESNRSQYEALLQRLKEVSVASGVGASQVSIVDRAKASDFPFSPNPKRMLLQAIIFSLVIGVGLAFVFEYIDDTIKVPSDVEEKLQVAAIGVVPRSKTLDPVAEVVKDAGSSIAESISSARTALQFSTPTGVPSSLLVTSVRPSEGKTSTCTALGIAFSRIGLKVLIIDADMRRPSFFVDAEQSQGLSGLLTQGFELMDHVVAGEIENLHLLPCGIIPPNPSELLAGNRLAELIREAESKFDLVLIDSPPVLGFADAPALSSVCGGTILVIQAGAIRTPSAIRALARLRQARSNIVGAVLTKMKAEGFGYGYGYGMNYETSYNYGGGERRLANREEKRRRIRLFSSRPDAPTSSEEELL